MKKGQARRREGRQLAGRARRAKTEARHSHRAQRATWPRAGDPRRIHVSLTSDPTSSLTKDPAWIGMDSLPWQHTFQGVSAHCRSMCLSCLDWPCICGLARQISPRPKPIPTPCEGNTPTARCSTASAQVIHPAAGRRRTA